MEENREYKEAERKYQEVYDKLYIDLPKRTADLTEKGASKEEFDALAKERLELEEELVKYSDEMSRIASQMMDTKDTVSFKFANNETTDSLVERLDRAVEDGLISREHADRLFEEAGEKLHLQEAERINELRAERERLEGYVSDNRDERDLLASEDSAKEENLQGHNNAISQLEERISEIDREIEDLEEIVNSAPESVEVSAPKEEITDEKVENEPSKLTRKEINKMVDEIVGMDDGAKKKAIENHEQYGFKVIDIAKICAAIHDDDYKKDFVLNFEKKGYGLYHNEANDIAMVCSSIEDDEFKKEILKNPSKYGLDDYQIATIITSLKEDNKDIIRNADKHNLSSTAISYVLEKIDDDEFKKEVINNNEKYHLTRLDDIKRVTRSIKNEAYREEIARDWKKYGFMSSDISSIINNKSLIEALKNEIDEDESTIDFEDNKELDDALNNYQAIQDRIDKIKEELTDKNKTKEEKDSLKQELDNLYGSFAEAGEAVEKASKGAKDYSKLTSEEIDAMSESEKKDIVVHFKDYGLNGRQIANIVKTMEDDEFKKEVLESNVYQITGYPAIDILNSIKDREYWKQNNGVETLTFDPSAFDGKQDKSSEEEKSIEELGEENKEEIEPKKEIKKDTLTDADKIEVAKGTYALDSGTWYMSEEQVKERILDEVLEIKKELKPFKDELTVEYGHDADDFDGVQTATYRVYRGKDKKEAKEPVVTTETVKDILAEGTYALDSGTWYMSEEQIKERILDEVLKRNNELKPFRDELKVEYNQNADDFDGTQTATYKVYREREVEKENASSKKVNDLKQELEETYDETLNELNNRLEQNTKEIEKLEKELEEINKDKSKKTRKEMAARDSEIAAKNTRIANLKGENSKLEKRASEINEKVSLTKETNDKKDEYVEELTKESDYQEPSLEERISNIEKTLADIASKVSELKEEFDKNKQEIADLDEKSKNAVDDKEIAETNTRIANLRGRNNNIAREIKAEETKVESLTEERENLQTEKMAKEELTPEEYEEIFGTLKNKDITRKILKEKGIYDIYRKRVEDRTPEEVAKLKATFAVIIDEIANAKLKNRDASIMDLVQVIYNFDDKVTLEGPAKETQMTSNQVNTLMLTAGKEPAKIQGSSKNSAHEAAPEDMQDAMESSLRGRGLEEVVHIFEDEDGKKYVRDVNLNRLRIEDPVRTYIANENGLTEIDGNEADDIRGQKLIEISEDDVKRIEENANNELSPYRVEHTDISQLTNAASNNDSDSNSEPSEENTSDDEYDYEEVFSGVYPMDNIPGISSLDEDAQIEAVNNAMIDWAILQNPELKNYDRSELVVVPGAQAEDVADGNDYGETQVTPFKIMRKIKKEKDKTDIPEPPVGDDDTQNKDDDPTPKPPVGDDDNTPTPPENDDDNTPTPPAGEDQNDDDKNNTNDKDKYLYVKRIISELKAKTYEETDDKYKTKNDVKTYQASQLKVWEAFKRELTTGRVEYNVVGIGKAVLTLVGGSASKFISKYVKARSAQRGEELSNRFDELWEKLSPEEKMVVYEKYKGGIMQEFGVNYTDFNRLILPKMREIGMNKVQAYNDELGINYQMLIATKKAVDEIDERLNSENIPQQEQQILLAERKELVHKGGELALRIRDLQELAASELSSGIHGIEEDFKAQQSKMIYVGFRWAKNQSLSDEDEKELIGITQKFEDSVNKMKASGDDQSYEDVMNSFLDEDKFFLDHTSIKKTILGEQSVGETYFTTYAKMFNYNGDPFVRNLLLTASMAMTAYGAINAVRTHVMETRDFNEALAQHNKILNQKEATINKHGQDILGQRDAIENAEKFRTRGSANDLATTYEVRGLDKTAPGKGGWNISDPAYTPRDKTYHADYNGVNDYINTEFTDIARRKASGAIDADQALQEVFQVSENVTDKFLELARAYLPELQKYAKDHPQHDRQAMLDSLEYMINNANAVKDGHAAIETINGIAVELTKFQLDSFEGVVPSDLASTLAALGTGMALCGRIAKETRDSMNPNNHKKYGDSIVDELRSYFYGDEAEEQELEEMMDDENEDENENENENSRSR